VTDAQRTHKLRVWVRQWRDQAESRAWGSEGQD